MTLPRSVALHGDRVRAGFLADRFLPALWFGVAAVGHHATMLAALGRGSTDLLDIGRSVLAQLFCGLIAALFLIRYTPPTARARPIPVAVALTGTLIMSGISLQPLVIRDGPLRALADGLLISGLAWSIYAMSSLGRCFGLAAEARGLVTSGAYRIVRHPLYLGEFVAACGLLLPVLTPWSALLFGIFCLCQVARAVLEEGVLAGAFAEYADYRHRTPAVLPWPRPRSSLREHEDRAGPAGDGEDQ